MELVAPPARAYLAEYLARAPMALALERAHECEVFRGRRLVRPVLDLGCGDGIFAEVLFGPGARVCYGLDSDPVELAKARARRVYRTLLFAHADAIPLPDHACASVYSNSALEHIPALDATLREVRRVLRPGGELLVTVPTDRYERYCTQADLLARAGLHALGGRLQRRFNAFWRHYHCHPPAVWRDRLAAAGFETVETVEYAPAAICRLLAAATPAALPGLLTNRLLGRWSLAPALRARVAPLLARALASAVRVGCRDGGLVFLRAARSDGAR